MTTAGQVAAFAKRLKEKDDLELRLLLFPLWNHLHTRRHEYFCEFNETEFSIMYQSVKQELNERGIEVDEIVDDANADAAAADADDDADVAAAAEAKVTDSKSWAELASIQSSPNLPPLNGLEADEGDSEADKGNSEADEGDSETEAEAEVENERRLNRNLWAPRSSNTLFLFGPVQMGPRRLFSILRDLNIGFVCKPEVHIDLGEGKKIYKVSIGLNDQTVANRYSRHTAVPMQTGGGRSIPAKLL